MRGLVKLFQDLVSLFRVASLLVFALFLPQFFIWHGKNVQQPQAHANAAQFKLGIENVSDSLASNLSVEGESLCRVGLITNQTGTDQAGNRNIEILLQKGFDIKKVFTPTQSLEADKELQTKNKNFKLSKETTVIALQRQNNGSLFSAHSLLDIDVLMFDLQDAGMRQYGYITLLFNAMQAAKMYDKKFIVLDRPNLLGWCMEGACSFGSEKQVAHNVIQDTMPIPMRHGMTIGEIATYFNKHVLETPVNLQVIPMQHYNRQSEARKPLLCSLSPNISTIDSCYGYSFLGLLGEVTPFEIGIGTDKAFQCILLPEQLRFPKQKWHELRTVLKEHGIESKLYRCFSQRKKQYCSGVRLYIQDINRFSSFHTLLTVLQFFKKSGVSLAFSEQFDKTLGTGKVRSLLEGTIKYTELAFELNEELQTFFKKAFNCFLYKPFPKMIHV